jgi:DNA-binding response OmpR family regulator
MELPVLIVEDDLSLSEALARQIESADIPVDRCQSAEVAVQLLRAKRYGLIVLDLMLLDGASGVYVLDHLRGSESSGAPVLVITACNVDNLRSIDRCLVKAIMLKPLDFDLFRAYALATYGSGVALPQSG